MSNPAFIAAQAKYPDLMVYIVERNKITSDWYDQLRADEKCAVAGGLAQVAEQLTQAQKDYGKFPYNSAMGDFLGLPLKDNHEPERGYYMASCVKSYFNLGVAEREAASLIEAGKTVKMVAAKSKKTGLPIRFHAFCGAAQIGLENGGAVLNNGKVQYRLSGGYSIESVMQKLAKALRSGEAYGV